MLLGPVAIAKSTTQIFPINTHADSERKLPCPVNQCLASVSLVEAHWCALGDKHSIETSVSLTHRHCCGNQQKSMGNGTAECLSFFFCDIGATLSCDVAEGIAQCGKWVWLRVRAWGGVVQMSRWSVHARVQREEKHWDDLSLWFDGRTKGEWRVDHTQIWRGGGGGETGTERGWNVVRWETTLTKKSCLLKHTQYVGYAKLHTMMLPIVTMVWRFPSALDYMQHSLNPVLSCFWFFLYF